MEKKTKPEKKKKIFYIRNAMRLFPFFVIWMEANFLQKEVDVIPNNRIIEGLAVHNNKILLGKSSGHFSILQDDMTKVNEYHFPNSIRKISAVDNTLLLQMDSRDHTSQSLIYYHTEDKRKHRVSLTWNDTSILEDIHPLTQYYVRMNYFGEIRMTDLKNKTIYIHHLSHGVLQKAYLFFDFLFIITQNNELLIYRIRNQEVELQTRIQLQKVTNIVNYLYVNKMVNLYVMVIGIHQTGFFVYYLTEDEDAQELKPVHQSFFPMTTSVQAFTASLPFLFILSDLQLYVIRLSSHADRKFKIPTLLFHVRLNNDFMLSDKMIFLNKCLYFNGHRYLQQLCLRTTKTDDDNIEN